VVNKVLQFHGGYSSIQSKIDIERFDGATKVHEVHQEAKENEKVIIGRNILERTKSSIRCLIKRLFL
jgi:hypothetical protein